MCAERADTVAELAALAVAEPAALADADARAKRADTAA